MLRAQKNIFEANVGVKLVKTHDLWLDAGIFSSHIEFESAFDKDCWTLTRSMTADNSPYYEAGAKLSYGNQERSVVLQRAGAQRLETHAAGGREFHAFRRLANHL